MSQETRRGVAEVFNILSVVGPILWGVFVFAYVVSSTNDEAIMEAHIVLGLMAMYIIAVMMAVAMAVVGCVLWLFFRALAVAFDPDGHRILK